MAVLGLALVVLSACSTARILYGQADWLLLREMDRYLDLRDEQREQAAGLLEVSLDRHRTEQLPRLASVLRAAAERARRPITDEDARWAYEQGHALLAATAQELLPLLAATLADLEAAQRAHLRRRLEERNADFRDDHWLDRPRAERFGRRAERAVERIEKWTGPLSEEQVALVAAVRDGMPDTAALWLAYTEQQQQRLLAMLEADAAADDIESFLRAWWLRREDMPTQLAALQESRLAGMRELLVRLGASLDSVQRAHLVKRLESLAEDASSLARAA